MTLLKRLAAAIKGRFAAPAPPPRRSPLRPPWGHAAHTAPVVVETPPEPKSLARMEDIRPGMSRDDEARVTLAILQACRRSDPRGFHVPKPPKATYVTDRAVIVYELWEGSEGDVMTASWRARNSWDNVPSIGRDNRIQI